MSFQNSKVINIISQNPNNKLTRKIYILSILIEINVHKIIQNFYALKGKVVISLIFNTSIFEIGF